MPSFLESLCKNSAVRQLRERVPGNDQASLYEGRLFLFANEQGKQMFTVDPKAFANADLAFDGNCAVCHVDMQHSMAGKPEFTVVQNGLRYPFPAAEQRDMFLASPKKYEAVATSVQPAADGSSSGQPAGSSSVTRRPFRPTASLSPCTRIGVANS